MGQADSVHGAWAFFLAGIELLFILHDIYCGCGWVWVGGCAGRDVILTTHGLSIAVWESHVMLTFSVKYKPRRMSERE